MNGIRKPKRESRKSAPRVYARSASTAHAGGAYLVHDRARSEELAGLRRERKELQDALFDAARVQKKLCAPRELRRGPFEIAGEVFPVRHLSGDFFRVFDAGAAVGFAVGDIAGKGISAGLWITHLIGLVHLYAREGADPGAAMAAINRGLCGMVAEPPLAALFVARLDPLSGELAYCNAGQPAAVLLRRDGKQESLQEGGPLLGAVPDGKFACGQVTLVPGDTLVACTDGAPECRNAREEEFGAKRLAAAALAAGATSASQTLFSTLAAVLDFADGRALDDDLTLAVLHRRAQIAPGSSPRV